MTEIQEAITGTDRWRNGMRAFLFLFVFLLGIKSLGDKSAAWAISYAAWLFYGIRASAALLFGLFD